MTAAINLNPLARILAERMLNSMIEGIAIGFFAWALLQVVGRRNSSTRFAVWFSALLAVAAVPFIGSVSSANYGQGAASTLTLPSSWALDIFIAWAVIAGLALVRVGVGILQLRKLRASCVPIAASFLDPVLQKTLQEVQGRSVALCQSDRIKVPTAIGFLKPLVALPMWVTQELSTAELNSILIHELAHLRRRDDWTNLAQQILKALLFFHPAVWWIESKLALEREMACDDAVLAETANPRGYAQCLVSIAEKSLMRRGLALAQAAVNRVRQTSLRVTQILDVNRPCATHVWKPALYSVAAFSIVSLVTFSRAPELVAFKDKAPNIAVVSPPVPSGTSFSASELHRFTQEVATLASMRTATATRTTIGITHHHARKQDALKAIEAMLALPDAGHETRVPRSSAPAPGSERRSAALSSPEPSTPASSREYDATPQTIFVMMQSEQYSQAGLLWQIRVWQLTVFDSGHSLGSTRIPAKKI